MRVRRGFLERRKEGKRLARELAHLSVLIEGLRILEQGDTFPELDGVLPALRWEGDRPPAVPAGMPWVDVTLPETMVARVAALAARYGTSQEVVVKLAGIAGAEWWLARERGERQ